MTCFAGQKNDYDISYVLLSGYKKTEKIYREKLKGYLEKYEKEYDVADLDLERVLKAIVYYEACNSTLVSDADAFDFMQVIRSTRKYMGEIQGPAADPMKKFSVGDEVIVSTEISALYVRTRPSKGGDILGSVKINSRGVIVDGPIPDNIQDIVWWKVDYGKLKGWSSGKYLAQDLGFNEAGVEYIAFLANHLRGYLTRKYGDFLLSRLHDLIIAAYNGGPTVAEAIAVAEGRSVPVETFQYRIGTGVVMQTIFNAENEIKKEIKKLSLVVLKKPHSWEELASRFDVPLFVMRLFNAFLAARYLDSVPSGETIVFPLAPANYLTSIGEGKDKKYYYVVRHGDILHHIANVFFRTRELVSKPPDSVYDYLRDKIGGSMWALLNPGTWIDVTESPYLDREESKIIGKGIEN